MAAVTIADLEAEVHDALDGDDRPARGCPCAVEPLEVGGVERDVALAIGGRQSLANRSEKPRRVNREFLNEAVRAEEEDACVPNISAK